MSMSITICTENIEILTHLRHHSKLIGVSKLRLPVRYQYIPITWIQRITILSITSFATLSSFWYFCFEAKKRNEISESLAYAISYLLMLILYSISIWRQERIEHIFTLIQDTIQRRKLQNMFRNIQCWSDCICNRKRIGIEGGWSMRIRRRRKKGRVRKMKQLGLQNSYLLTLVLYHRGTTILMNRKT